MRTLAEHLLDPTLPLTADSAGLPSLHIQYEKRAVTIATVVYFVQDGAAVPLLNTLLRPAQFADVQAEFAEFNADTERGWARLAIESARNIDVEADELVRKAEALRAQSQQLNWAFIDRA